MLPLFQLFLAVFAIYSALTYEEEMRLIVPLGCLIIMFIVSRVDKSKTEKKTARKSYLKSEIDKISKKDPTTIREQDFFTIETLLWPKSELLLLDAIHSIFRDLGFKVMAGAGVNYQWVDRIIKIPDTQKGFGLQVMMSEGEAEKNHPKVNRALQFEKEKKENEKSLIIASTHVHLPLSERGEVNHISKELVEILTQYNMSFLTAHHLYELWQKAKNGEIDIFGFFQKIYSHRGGLYPMKGTEGLFPSSFDLPIQ